MNNAWDQFSAAFDFPEYSGKARAYLIASTPRTGSHYLAHLLQSTGQLGSPFEYLHPEHRKVWREKLKTNNARLIFRWLISHRTSPNGWFGLKAHWRHFEKAIRNPALVDHATFEKIIYIDRKDTVAQAISMVIARQTGSWISFQEPRGVPTFDRAAIERSIASLKSQKEAWLAHFDKLGVPLHTLSYEELITATDAAVNSILKYFELPEPHSGTSTLWLPERQHSRLNDEWYERFHDASH